MRNYIVLLLATAFGTTMDAQVRPPSPTAPRLRLPILRPRVVELARFRDSAGGVLPYEVALSPNGRLMVYFGCASWTTDICMMVWNTVTHEHHELVTGPVIPSLGGGRATKSCFRPTSGLSAIAARSYRGSSAIWTIRLDSVSGEPMEAPHLVANAPVNHGVFFSPDQQTIAFAQWHGWYVSSVSVVPAAGARLESWRVASKCTACGGVTTDRPSTIGHTKALQARPPRAIAYRSLEALPSQSRMITLPLSTSAMTGSCEILLP